MHLAADGCELLFHAHQLARTSAGRVNGQWANGGRVVANRGGMVAMAARSPSESPLRRFRLPEPARVVLRVLHARESRACRQDRQRLGQRRSEVCPKLLTTVLSGVGLDRDWSSARGARVAS